MNVYIKDVSMKIKLIILFLLSLTGCSGVSKVCDDKNICLETWRNVSATSIVTVSQLRTAKNNPIPGGTVTSTSSGVLSYIDPLSSDISTSADEAKDIKDAIQ